MDTINEVYKRCITDRFWGFETSLKPQQGEIIQRVMDGKDTLSILPTGFGKTLCIFAPPIIMAQTKQEKCTCLVVSPLISLAMQQEKTLLNRQQTVLSFPGHELTRADIRNAFDSLESSRVLFLLASPENLRKHWVRSLLGEINVVSISVDEGHCVTEWGDEFRKDYKFLYELRAFCTAPVSVFTATVTKAMKEDIIKLTGLRITSADEMIMSPERKEIYLQVCRHSKDNKALAFIPSEIAAHGKNAGKVLIFCATVSQVTDLYYWLRGKLPNDGQVWEDGELVGCRVEMLFGNTDLETKGVITEDFCKVNSITRVMVATTAFGMGVNVEGLNTVVTFGTPASAPELMQMIGRCSRDGSPGKALVFLPLKPFPGSLQSRLQSACMRKVLNKELVEPTVFINSARCGGIDKCCTYCTINKKPH